MKVGTNAQSKPEREGQIVKFISPHNAQVVLYDIAKWDKKYKCLAWWALNEPTEEQLNNAVWGQ